MTIDIDNLTIAQLRQITALVGHTTTKRAPHHALGKHVIVRGYGAGVFFGRLSAKRGNEVDLADCRRIWNWKGANTLSEIALSGIVAKGSRVAKATPLHTVLDVIEIIPCSDAAIWVLAAAEWTP